MGVFDHNVPRRVEILRKLVEDRRTGLFSVRHYNTLAQIYRTIGASGQADGTAKEIIKEFISSGMLKVDREGFYMDLKSSWNEIKNSVYGECIRLMGVEFLE